MNAGRLFAVPAPLADVSDQWGTPDPLFAGLNQEFRFTVDAAATAANTKLPEWFSDGLDADWDGQRVWCNPPFSALGTWVKKAATSTADVAVLLVPANRTDRGWWHQWIEPHRCGGRLEVRFLPGRVFFLRPGAVGVGSERPAFGCCLLIWRAA